MTGHAVSRFGAAIRQMQSRALEELKAHHTLYATGHPTHSFLQQNVTLAYHHISIPKTHIRFLTNTDTPILSLPSVHLSYGFPILTSSIPPIILGLAALTYYLHKQHRKSTVPTDTSSVVAPEAPTDISSAAAPEDNPTPFIT